MILDVTFEEQNTSFDICFGEVNNVSDGGYERGYGEGYTKGEIDGYNKGHTDGQEVGYNNGYEKGNADGYNKGHADGYNTGYNDGLAKRIYEIWTFTLADGSIVEKEVALL